MISRLRGQLISPSPCIVEVGGVGFEVQIPERDRDTVSAVSGDVTFFTYLYVREDRLVLYGFQSAEDRELFTQLIGVSGVGPRTAINSMGVYRTERIAQAIVGKDIAFLCKLPGVGRKTAERITIELKEKLEAMALAPVTQMGGAAAVREEAILALATLGMSRGAAENALEKIDWKAVGPANLETIIKEALKVASA